jgi:beta-aspartyl-peptidase (threonine type)
MNTYTITIHGGAGTILKEDMSADLEQAYKDALQEALDAGYNILNNGSAVEAVNIAVMKLENNVLFNAGRFGFYKKGEHEMDASIMDGSNLMAGAVAGVKNVVNPVELAKTVMLESDHVFLSGGGAVDFALQKGLLWLAIIIFSLNLDTINGRWYVIATTLV